MADIAIRVEQVRKRYRIASGPQAMWGTKTLRDALAWRSQLLARKLGRAWRGGEEDAAPADEFWALDDLSFEIKVGEVVGIIGRNGAGKSTLLKILSRITEPTEGRITLHGRVGSLLEVGTGFHPELSGRENIYLNGAILGMRRAEIARKFDEIVAFSEIERFLDTPVKRYSSGMYVRLAFAVAAHLEPEILLVDEVLAVGDTAFQQKCLGKMSEVARGGRTVLFVSHNISSIVALCQTGLLLDRGRLVHYGDVDTAVSGYFSGRASHGEHLFPAPTHARRLFFTRIALGKEHNVCTIFNTSDVMQVRSEFTVTETITGAQISFELYNEREECLFTSTNQDHEGTRGNVLLPGQHVAVCAVPLQQLRAGKYSLKFCARIPDIEMFDQPGHALVFDLYDDSSPIMRLGQHRQGMLLPVFPWDVQRSG